MKFLAIVILALALTACRTPTKFGVSLDVPVFGHLEIHGDPVGEVVNEVKGVGSSVGLAAAATPSK